MLLCGFCSIITTVIPSKAFHQQQQQQQRRSDRRGRWRSRLRHVRKSAPARPSTTCTAYLDGVWVGRWNRPLLLLCRDCAVMMTTKTMRFDPVRGPTHKFDNFIQQLQPYSSAEGAGGALDTHKPFAQSTNSIRCTSLPPLSPSPPRIGVYVVRSQRCVHTEWLAGWLVGW